MPSKLRFLVSIRGDEPAAQFLEKLLEAVREDGADVETFHQLGWHALVALGERYGLEVPERARPHGTNRYTANT